jgi:hypothetical protein
MSTMYGAGAPIAVPASRLIRRGREHITERLTQTTLATMLPPPRDPDGWRPVNRATGQPWKESQRVTLMDARGNDLADALEVLAESVPRAVADADQRWRERRAAWVAGKRQRVAAVLAATVDGALAGWDPDPGGDTDPGVWLSTTLPPVDVERLAPVLAEPYPDTASEARERVELEALTREQALRERLALILGRSWGERTGALKLTRIVGALSAADKVDLEAVLTEAVLTEAERMEGER